MQFRSDDQHYISHVQCVPNVFFLPLTDIMEIEIAEVAAVLVKDDRLSHSVRLPDEERLTPEAGVGRKMDMHKIAVLHRVAKLQVGLYCDQKLAKPGAILHSADIGEIDHLAKTGIVQVIDNSRDSSMDAAIRADHENV